MDEKHLRSAPIVIAIAVIISAVTVGFAMYYSHQVISADHDYLKVEVQQLKQDVRQLQSELRK